MTELSLFAVHSSYLFATALFILGLRRMGRVRTARGGSAMAGAGMLIAIITTLLTLTNTGRVWIIAGLGVGSLIGAALARMVEMTKMPELVAFFNGVGGAASALVALSFFFALPLEEGHTLGAVVDWHVVLVLAASIVIGAVTLTGSMIAYGKLSGRISGNAVLLPGRHAINILLAVAMVTSGVIGSWVVTSPTLTILLWMMAVAIACLLGVLLVLPIGGADMPVVISLLNSYSGIAASMAGFVLLVTAQPAAYVLIVSGALVGASGIVLTNIMCVAMNRSLLSVLVGGFGEGGESGPSEDARHYDNVRSMQAEELALLLESAEQVILVPGYGLAVAQAQHALAELDELLTKRGATVKYAIHPVAGRMPGHMNVLLAEANVPYEKLFALEDINSDFKNTDVVIVVGANDVVNPAAIEDPKSPIAGMPILNCHEARSAVIIKRSLSPGYAGIKNPLFERDNAMMFFADAKKALLETTKELKDL